MGHGPALHRPPCLARFLRAMAGPSIPGPDPWPGPSVHDKGDGNPHLRAENSHGSFGFPGALVTTALSRRLCLAGPENEPKRSPVKTIVRPGNPDRRHRPGFMDRAFSGFHHPAFCPGDSRHACRGDGPGPGRPYLYEKAVTGIYKTPG